MEYSQIKELIDLIDKSSLKEFSLKFENAEISMSKNNSVENTKPAEIKAESIPANPSAPVTILPKEADVPKAGNVVKAPIVGVFYSKPAPDKPPFKSAGDQVEAGEVLCIIEAMKVMNEITSKYSGVVAEVLVDNEEEVEFGQPLFRIV